MYRKRKYGSRKYNAAASAAARMRKRLNSPAPDYPADLPELRRKIVVTDYDFGEPAQHEILLFRSNRIDCYRCVVDGREISKKIGSARVLELVRKAFPRIRAGAI